MADLVNEFSWSRSRDATFQDCRRKYYLHYYGSWATTAPSSASIVSLAWQHGHSTLMDLGVADMASR